MQSMKIIERSDKCKEKKPIDSNYLFKHILLNRWSEKELQTCVPFWADAEEETNLKCDCYSKIYKWMQHQTCAFWAYKWRLDDIQNNKKKAFFVRKQCKYRIFGGILAPNTQARASLLCNMRKRYKGWIKWSKNLLREPYTILCWNDWNNNAMR